MKSRSHHAAEHAETLLAPGVRGLHQPREPRARGEREGEHVSLVHVRSEHHAPEVLDTDGTFINDADSHGPARVVEEHLC